MSLAEALPCDVAPSHPLARLRERGWEPVARIERSEIRGRPRSVAPPPPGFASLNPGYGLPPGPLPSPPPQAGEGEDRGVLR
jgi:hypothetical protein